MLSLHALQWYSTACTLLLSLRSNGEKLVYEEKMRFWNIVCARYFLCSRSSTILWSKVHITQFCRDRVTFWSWWGAYTQFSLLVQSFLVEPANPNSILGAWLSFNLLSPLVLYFSAHILRSYSARALADIVGGVGGDLSASVRLSEALSGSGWRMDSTYGTLDTLRRRRRRRLLHGGCEEAKADEQNKGHVPSPSTSSKLFAYHMCTSS